MQDITYYPLTSPQLSIWYTDKMYPHTSISNVAGTLKIKEKVDFNLFTQAINLFIKNNEGIRLRLCLDDNGNPCQYISDYQYQGIEIKDFSNCNDPVKAMYEWDSQETLKPFELLNSDLYHFVILKLSDTEGGIFTKIHHIISDAWSMSLMCNVVTRCYFELMNNKGDANKNTVLPSYLSFIHNEQLYKESNRYIKDKLFWENKFECSPEVTVLKQRNTNTKSTRSKRKTFVAPKKFTNLLRSYCAENKISPYPLFLSALAMYINRISAKEDLIIGTPIINRLNQVDKSTFGMFISTIPLYINIKSEDSFSSFFRDIIDLCSTSYRHQRYPYDSIIRYVREKHGFSDNLYDIVLSYQNSKLDISHELNYSTRWHFNENQSNSLTIHINDRDDEGVLIIDYDYHIDLYYDKEIEFIHQHVLSLLWHALDNPNNKICKIEILPESEKKKLLYEFNDTGMVYPREKLIHQLFEEQVKKTPDKVALKFEDKTLTYRELNNRSNQLAHLLRQKEVKADQVVGLLINRSLEMIIGILGILKAGGAFMPIEPDYPVERIKYMLEESNTSIVLSSKDIYENKEFDVEFIDIFNDSLYDSAHTKDLNPLNQSTHLAYLIYTSGSTGTPKGVMIEHRALHNFIISIKNLFDINEKSVVLSAASICFDVFILEIMPALIYGSVLIIANNEEQKIPFLLSNLIIQNDVTTMLTTPAKIKLLLNDDHCKHCLAKIQHIMSGGEKFEPQFLAKLKEQTKAKIINAYGPTETTIASTFKDLSDTNKITIGKPINNTKVFILDSSLNLVPIGIQGELYISGESLARGYINNDELTEKAFIPSPLDSNDRLYKTGDIARWYPKGEIEFLGRKDKQIKLRGYRIELDEIENIILQCSGIKDVAVVIKSRNSYDDFICAYYVCGEGTIISPNDLKGLLSTHLPRHMIPSFLVQVNNIPLTSNGKTDFRKLPEINFDKKDNEKMILPSNKIEAKLFDVLRKLLKIDDLSVTGDIFEYGADSLTVIQLISFFDREGYRLSTEDVYKNPTISKLSNIIRQKDRKNVNYNDKHSKSIIVESDISKLIIKGDLPKIDSAALTYIPNDSGILMHNDQPFLYNYMKTSLGNIGVFALPIIGMDLYREKDRLLSLGLEGIKQAEYLGAKIVSLTGLIPSATNYGIDIANNIKSEIQVTTGHATTAASVVLSIERLIIESNRDIQNEDILVLGMGSVGTAVTELLLSLYTKTKRITLCDLYQKSDYLNGIKRKLKKNYNGEINIIYSRANSLPPEAYDSTLIIGATNAPDIIDVHLLKPGTLIIDDSGPHCFSKDQAIKRLNRNGDILFTEGGVIYSESPMDKYVYLPEYVDKSIKQDYYQHFISKHEITGCILSSLLTTKFREISPTIGAVKCNDSVKHYHILKNNHFSGATLHCDDFVIPQQKVDLFRKLFGKVIR